MAGKALNKKILEALSAEALAELLMKAVKGDAARQQRVRMALSALIDQVVLTPSEDGYDIDLHGDLAAILTLASDTKAKPAEEAGIVSDDCSLNLVAGAGFDLYRTSGILMH